MLKIRYKDILYKIKSIQLLQHNKKVHGEKTYD